MLDAVVLLSGGLDSYTAAAIARAEGFRLNALTIRYGQRHASELAAARKVANWLADARHDETEVLGAHDIVIGVNALDYSGYPDCRPEFIAVFEQLASLATARGVLGERFRIHAPLQMMTKREIIQKGVALGLDYGLTHSCYDPGPSGPCGRCDSCILRANGFAEAGVDDPIVR